MDKPYVPDPVSDVGDLSGILSYIRREFDKVSDAMQLGHARQVDFLHAEPTKVWEGLTVGADGTDWNPGAGQGVYTYYNAGWHRLG